MENVSPVTSPRERNGTTTHSFSSSRIESAPSKACAGRLQTLLDDVHGVLSSSNSIREERIAAVDQLFHSLRDLRLSVSEDQWNEIVAKGMDRMCLQCKRLSPPECLHQVSGPTVSCASAMKQCCSWCQCEFLARLARNKTTWPELSVTHARSLNSSVRNVQKLLVPQCQSR